MRPSVLVAYKTRPQTPKNDKQMREEQRATPVVQIELPGSARILVMDLSKPRIPRTEDEEALLQAYGRRNGSWRELLREVSFLDRGVTFRGYALYLPGNCFFVRARGEKIVPQEEPQLAVALNTVEANRPPRQKWRMSLGTPEDTQLREELKRSFGSRLNWSNTPHRYCPNSAPLKLAALAQ